MCERERERLVSDSALDLVNFPFCQGNNPLSQGSKAAFESLNKKGNVEYSQLKRETTPISLCNCECVLMQSRLRS